MNKLLTSIVLALFLFSVSVMAQSGSSKGVELSIKNVKNAINANDYAEFDIVITNNQQKDSDFFIAKNFYSEKWRVTADPYLVSVGSGFTRSTRLSIQPTKFLLPAKYKLVVLVESRDKTFSKELSFEVEIVPFGDDNVKTELIIDDKIDPRLGSTARVSLESLYNFGISNVRLSLYSDLFSFEKNFNLKANKEFDITFSNNLLHDNSGIEDEEHSNVYRSMELYAVFSNLTRKNGYSMHCHGNYISSLYETYFHFLGFKVIDYFRIEAGPYNFGVIMKKFNDKKISRGEFDYLYNELKKSNPIRYR